MYCFQCVCGANLETPATTGTCHSCNCGFRVEWTSVATVTGIYSQPAEPTRQESKVVEISRAA